ncbi:MAG TPA: extracellular solute-binding protein [Ktedonobacteraceae bacterium]|nr:extracellular solute-binding protein [Ktedonobacteraceae bacterium]
MKHCLSHRRSFPLLALGLILLLLSACGTTTSSGTTPTPAAKGTVAVAYAASLSNIMEHAVKSAFDQSTGYAYQGEAKGSSALINEIKGKLSFPDVFISANPKLNAQLMGAANGNYASWYLDFARAEMVIGYNANSKFAADFQAAANGSKQWYQVLQEPGLRLGRTDPLLDPKGVNTIYTLELAEAYYHQPGLTQKILGGDENTSQIFPEEELVARMGAGQLDAGFFYINEVKGPSIPYISLPDQVNLGNATMATQYATVSWKNPKTNAVSKGAPVVYTITVLNTAKNKAGGIAFANFLLSSQGQSLLQAQGVLTTPFTAGGDTTTIPQQLQRYVQS